LDLTFDALIIGAGVIGCAIARELSRYKLKIGILEKASDLFYGNSARNSGVLHAGFNNVPGSLMARFCVEGNKSFDDLARELGIPYRRTGKLVVGFTKKDREKLEEMIATGERNGVPGLAVIGKDKIKELAPQVAGEFAMWSGSTAILDPFAYVLALAQNAHKNGVRFFFDSEVTAIRECLSDADRSSGAVGSSSVTPNNGASTHTATSDPAIAPVCSSMLHIPAAPASSSTPYTSAVPVDSSMLHTPAAPANSNTPHTPTAFADSSMLHMPAAPTDSSTPHTPTAPVYAVSAGGHTYSARWIINCAGLGADKIAKMLGCDKYTIHPCRGEYYVLDRIVGSLLPLPAYPVPDPKAGGLGIHLTPTMDGNILVGPSDEYITDADDYSTTRKIMDLLIRDGSRIFPYLKGEYFIRNFSGIRPKLAPKEQGGYHDFIIERDDVHPRAVNLIGLESPAMTGALPISREVLRLMRQVEAFEPNPYFDPIRPAGTIFRDLPKEEQAKLIRQNPDYGEIVCRCENITKAEVLEAIRGPIGARTVIGVKYRCRAMMGRCQGGYCQARLCDILMKELGLACDEVQYSPLPGSNMFT
jgi:L-2-hydroxyglutarate oxidase LhgO